MLLARLPPPPKMPPPPPLSDWLKLLNALLDAYGFCPDVARLDPPFCRRLVAANAEAHAGPIL